MNDNIDNEDKILNEEKIKKRNKYPLILIAFICVVILLTSTFLPMYLNIKTSNENIQRNYQIIPTKVFNLNDKIVYNNMEYIVTKNNHEIIVNVTNKSNNSIELNSDAFILEDLLYNYKQTKNKKYIINSKESQDIVLNYNIYDDRYLVLDYNENNNIIFQVVINSENL